MSTDSFILRKRWFRAGATKTYARSYQVLLEIRQEIRRAGETFRAGTQRNECVPQNRGRGRERGDLVGFRFVSFKFWKSEAFVFSLDVVMFSEASSFLPAKDMSA